MLEFNFGVEMYQKHVQAKDIIAGQTGERFSLRALQTVSILNTS